MAAPMGGAAGLRTRLRPPRASTEILPYGFVAKDLPGVGVTGTSSRRCALRRPQGRDAQGGSDEGGSGVGKRTG